MSARQSSRFTAVMRLARFRDPAGVHVGVIVDDEIIAVQHLGLELPDDIPAILAGGSPRLEQITTGSDKATRRETLEDVELLAPIPRPPKFLGAGMNYASHAAELREPPTPSSELTAALAAMGHLKVAYPNSPVPGSSTSRRAASAAHRTRSGRPSTRSRSTTKGSWRSSSVGEDGGWTSTRPQPSSPDTPSPTTSPCANGRTTTHSSGPARASRPTDPQDHGW